MLSSDIISHRSESFIFFVNIQIIKFETKNKTRHYIIISIQEESTQEKYIYIVLYSSVQAYKSYYAR